MNVEQFEARYKKAAALVDKTRLAYYKADGSANWALSRELTAKQPNGL